MLFRMRNLLAGALRVDHSTATADVESPNAPAEPASTPVELTNVHVTTHPAGPQPSDDVPWGLRVSAAWAWRLLLIAAATALFLWLFVQLSVVLVPVILGLLIAAVVVPAVDGLTRHHVPRGLATAIVVLGGIVFLGGLIALIAQQVSSGFDDLRESFAKSTDQIQDYLADLGIREGQLADFFDQLKEAASGDEGFGARALEATTTAGHVVAGLFIVLFVVIFFAYDGRRIWSWLVGLLPAPARQPADEAGRRSWAVLSSYVRAIVIIAAVDAVGIALVALILQLPFVLPIAVLVFLGAFIPVVGAAISGAAAVAVALVTYGPISALLMLAGVIAVQQIESHVLQPFLMGRMVRVHPLAVVLVIAVGGLTAGIFGALIAVPLAAVINTAGGYLAGRRTAGDDAGATTDVVAHEP